ncbi:MAG: hypothetical protein BWZ11_00676 [Bacteroidetes bacterium ADurb.BinA395]|nr:MAG: hypothetical protein BWZ11_00676 [Bacteroidetes bacterium ADurb.BinA395]
MIKLFFANFQTIGYLLLNKIFFQHFFQFLNFMFFFRMDDGNGNTFFVDSACSSTSVCVHFGIVRQIVVDDMREIAHVQSSGSNVGSHQQLNIANSEFLHHIVALCLRKISMQSIGIITILHKFFGNFFCFLTGSAKHNAINVGIEVYNPF